MLRIKKLDIFIAKQFGMLFMGTFFICQFVLMMQFLWKYVDDLIGKGLSMEVMAEFFWYMGLMLIPQALPLAILLSSLITFGNLGESSELTAIKAAGISLLQSFRSLIIISVVIMFASFYFQNSIAPMANMKIAQLLMSMKQKSPELEIPQGIFYDGIPNSNLYVQEKNVKTGKLYGIMIYRMTGSYEDQAIILADSGMLQSTADKKHLLLSLWNGEWFENMKSQEVMNSASVPYRRETFSSKQIVLDFDGDFNMTDASSLSSDARGKSLAQISHAIDSMNVVYDSIGHANYRQLCSMYYRTPSLPKADSLRVVKLADTKEANLDTIFSRLSTEQRRNSVNRALSQVQQELSDLEFKDMITEDGDRMIRRHWIEYVGKFTLALSCLIFFFIGAPLGAIIRKGGLGMPVIISVLVFIVYYMLDNTGYRMARLGEWSIAFGKGLAPGVLIPLAAFVTYKALNDSAVFSMDAYREFFIHLLGLRTKRNIFAKEVIIEEPDYHNDAKLLTDISEEVKEYNDTHHLKHAPNVVNVFFKYQPDHIIEDISDRLEAVIEDLGNSRDKVVIDAINNYPILAVKAHTRPFERKWMNITAAVIFPVGIFLYLRMWRFRLRLNRDLKAIVMTNNKIIARVEEMEKNAEEKADEKKM